MSVVKEEVSLSTKNLRAVLYEVENLTIPEYQRIYSWEERSVYQLLDDIRDYADQAYFLGTIILHHNNNAFEIVDGQQRLVTLSLLLQELGVTDFGLLGQAFSSENARAYIAYNRWLIRNYLKRNSTVITKEKVLDNLQFSVLVLKSKFQDLAYTFFDSNNAKGKPLSDYDLLKSHHLLHITEPSQAEYSATVWDALVKDSGTDRNDALARTFDFYLFRLRKWMRKNTWKEQEKWRVKNEFEAAPIVAHLPVYGGDYRFCDSLLGGAYFFGYAEHFLDLFKNFSKTEVYKELQKLNKEKHGYYREVIEALAFAYFVKFGQAQLVDASLLIMDLVSDHRYSVVKTAQTAVHRYVADKEIVITLDQAPSPSFFLAQMQQDCRRTGEHLFGEKSTRGRYRETLAEIKEKLQELSFGQQ